MTISEAAKKARLNQCLMYRREWGENIIAMYPTDGPNTCILVGLRGQEDKVVLPMRGWEPCLSDLTADDWELVEHFCDDGQGLFKLHSRGRTFAYDQAKGWTEVVDAGRENCRYFRSFVRKGGVCVQHCLLPGRMYGECPCDICDYYEPLDAQEGEHCPANDSCGCDVSSGKVALVPCRSWFERFCDCVREWLESR